MVNRNEMPESGSRESIKCFSSTGLARPKSGSSIWIKESGRGGGRLGLAGYKLDHRASSDLTKPFDRRRLGREK